MSDSPAEPGLPVEAKPPTAPSNLDTLAARLADTAIVYACLRDLLENGPIGTRGDSVVSRPSRSDILHFLAKWARSVGMTEQSCFEWLAAYALSSLRVISTSSASAIRHNAKGIVRYIYRVGYPFNCGKERNPIQCRCDPQCPVYHQAEAPIPNPAAAAALAAAADGSAPRQRIGRVKDHYREQYEKSLLTIREMRAAGEKIYNIVEHLNAQNLPTKTGRKWTIPILRRTLEDLSQPSAGPESPGPEAA